MEISEVRLVSNFRSECKLVGTSFSEEEIHKVVFQLGKEKALGQMDSP